MGTPTMHTCIECEKRNAVVILDQMHHTRAEEEAARRGVAAASPNVTCDAEGDNWSVGRGRSVAQSFVPLRTSLARSRSHSQSAVECVTKENGTSHKSGALSSAAPLPSGEGGPSSIDYTCWLDRSRVLGL